MAQPHHHPSHPSSNPSPCSAHNFYAYNHPLPPLFIHTASLSPLSPPGMLGSPSSNATIHPSQTANPFKETLFVT